MRAVRHAAVDCTGFVLTCKKVDGGHTVTSKRDQVAWSLIKGSTANANMDRLAKDDGAGISTFVNRPKIAKPKKANNDDDGSGNGETKNAYEAAVTGIAAIMFEINAIAPNDAEVLADLQTLLAMETKLKTKLLELKTRLAVSLNVAVGS